MVRELAVGLLAGGHFSVLDLPQNGYNRRFCTGRKHDIESNGIVGVRPLHPDHHSKCKRAI